MLTLILVLFPQHLALQLWGSTGMFTLPLWLLPGYVSQANRPDEIN